MPRGNHEAWILPRRGHVLHKAASVASYLLSAIRGIFFSWVNDYGIHVIKLRFSFMASPQYSQVVVGQQKLNLATLINA